MQQRTLTGTDLTVTRVCLGTMTFGSQVDQREAAAMIDLCRDRGVNFLDTANTYNGGESETILGKLLKGRREQYVLASKVGMKMGPRPDETGLSAAAIGRQIEQTLMRLQTEYLDIYYLHQPDYATPLEQTLASAEQLVRQGKVRYVGASNYASWQVLQMLWLADKRGYRPVRITQLMYNLLARNVETEFLPLCGEFQLARIVYNPLAGGMLAGKHKSDQPPDAGTRFDDNPRYQQRYWHRQNFEAIDRLKAAATEEGRTLVSLALNWLVHHTPTDCVILGASRLEQLRENLDAAEDGPLSKESIGVCDTVWDQLRGVSPRYNR